jgi:hypothetical protein
VVSGRIIGIAVNEDGWTEVDVHAAVSTVDAPR